MNNYYCNTTSKSASDGCNRTLIVAHICILHLCTRHLGSRPKHFTRQFVKTRRDVHAAVTRPRPRHLPKRDAQPQVPRHFKNTSRDETRLHLETTSLHPWYVVGNHYWRVRSWSAPQWHGYAVTKPALYFPISDTWTFQAGARHSTDIQPVIYSRMRKLLLVSG